MYTSVRRYRVHGSAAPGFRSYAVVDAGVGLLVTIAVFADRAGAEGAEQRAAAWLAEHLAGLVALEDGAAGEVLVDAGL